MTTDQTDQRPDWPAAEPLALRLNDQLGVASVALPWGPADAAIARNKAKIARMEMAKAANRRAMKAHADSLRQVEKIVEYDQDTPRCATCASFDSEQKKCRQHGFHCRPVGLCSTWQHPHGDRLE